MREQAGKTAFWFAVANENLEMTKLLHSHGSKINLPDKSGASVLTGTVLPKKYDVLDLLVAKGADINMADNSGVTPLMTAIGFKNTNQPVVLKYLEKFLTFKPKINYPSADYSDLHLAAFLGFVDAVKLLLEKGADVNLKNGAGESAMSYARRSGNNAIIALLESQGAKPDAPLVMKNVTIKELIGTWEGFQDGMPQVDAMRRVAAAIRNTAGVVGLFVDAKNQDVAAFYEKFGFIPLSDNSFSLMIPQQTIPGLFPDNNLILTAS